MTLRKRVELRCDWPAQLWPDGEPCRETDWQFGANGTELRRGAAKNGWLRAGEFDFCGQDPRGQYRTEPAPVHAARLDGHAPTAMDGGRGRLRPVCWCGWVCPEDTVHLHVAEGLVGGPKTAGIVWLEVHVWEHIAGMPPRWTPERIDNVMQRSAERDPRRETRR